GGGFRGGGGGGFRGGGFHGGGFRGGGAAFHGGGFRGGGMAIHRGGFRAAPVFRGGGMRYAYRHVYRRPQCYHRHPFSRGCSTASAFPFATVPNAPAASD